MINSLRCLIVGASHAGVTAAFALRREGWQGEIVLVDSDPHVPYHRPPLSKSLIENPDEDLTKHLLRPQATYEKKNIELRLGTWVHSIDTKTRTAHLDDQTLSYDTLVMATGGYPVVPPIEGLDQANHVYYIRKAEDTLGIRQALQTQKIKRAVVIGAGYIGLEAAAALRQRDVSVTVVERDKRPLARVTCPALAASYIDLHERQGVKFLLGSTVTALKDSGKKIVLDDNTILEADLIVVGVGIATATALAEDAGLDIDNGIKVSKTMQASDSNVYAIGDCCSFYHPTYQRRIRLESVQNAVDQAKVAAANICGKETFYDAIPWLWSDQYDKKLQMVGLHDGYDDLLILRKEDKSISSVWYFQGEQLLAVHTVNDPKAYVTGMKYLKTGAAVDRQEILHLTT